MAKMPVFGGKSNTITDYEDMELDNLLPPSGALNWKVDGIAAITEQFGRIAGATGVDAKVVHGNLWEAIDGNQGTVIKGTETRHTMENLRTYINNNETHEVTSGNLTTTIGQDWESTVGGDATETVNGEHFSLNVGAKTEVKMNARMVQQANETMETHWTPHMQFKSYVIDIESIGCLEVAPSVNEAFINKLEVGGFQEEFIAVVVGASAFDQAEHALECKIAGVKSDIESLEAEAKLLEAGTIQMINMGITLAIQSLCM
jgi:hypothetical protein